MRFITASALHKFLTYYSAQASVKHYTQLQTIVENSLLSKLIANQKNLLYIGSTIIGLNCM